MVQYLYQLDSSLIKGKDRHGKNALQVAQLYNASGELQLFLPKHIQK